MAQGSLLTSLASLPKEWRLTHDFLPTSYPRANTKTNSLHLVIGDNAWSTPAIGFSNNKMSITSSAAVFTTSPPPVGAWTTIQICQQLVDGRFMLQVSVAGQEVISEENRTPKDVSDVQVFASDPWLPAQPGAIRNLVIETKDDSLQGRREHLHLVTLSSRLRSLRARSGLHQL